MKKTISILKERKEGERRVIATPREIPLFIRAGYDVYVEHSAGTSAGFSDAAYKDSGAIIVDAESAWAASKLIIKYKPPIESEFRYLNKDKVLCAVFHAEGDKILVQRLLDSQCTAFSYEYFKTPAGVFPLSVASSEIAGKVAVIYGAYHLQAHLGGNGVLLAPVVNVNPPKVLIIGYGNAGGAAARLASAMGADVTVLGTDRERLRAFQATMPSGTRCLLNTPPILASEILEADLVIGAILISTFDTPAMIPEQLVKTMKKGSMIIDITAGYGAGFMPTFDKSTSFKHPTYVRFGVIHCKIDVLPLGYPTTTVDAMSQHLASYIIALGDAIYDNRRDATSAAGMIVKNGRVTNAEVLRHFIRSDD